jgi:hypothetical protein
MIKSIYGYTIRLTQPNPIEGSAAYYTAGPLPEGTDVYATISLSSIVSFTREPEVPSPVAPIYRYASASLVSYTYYLPPPGRSRPIESDPINWNTVDHSPNNVRVANCARITFGLYTQRFNDAEALINIYSLDHGDIVVNPFRLLVPPATHIAFDKRSGHILSVHKGATDDEYVRRSARKNLEITDEHIGIIVTSSDFTKIGKRYRVDTDRNELIETDSEANGVGILIGSASDIS